MDDARGYLFTFLGAAGGGFGPALAVNAAVAALIPDESMPLVLMGLLASVLLAWVGGPLGIWMALRLARREYAGRTAVLLILMLLLSSVALMPLMVLTPLAFSDTSLTVVALFTMVLSPLAAHWLAARRRLFRASI